jgi:glycosyltransferase involved in cell wall biosynthesis
MNLLFFTDNIDSLKGGLELENLEEIEYIKKSNMNYIIFPYSYLQYIEDIINKYQDLKLIIYIDFCNSPLCLLNKLNDIDDKNITIVLKYKGYKLNDFFINYIKHIKNVKLLTTITNKQINDFKINMNIKSIKYWRIKLIENPLLSIYLNFNPIFKSLDNYKDSFKFIFIGRKDKHKQIELLLESFIELLEDIKITNRESFKKQKIKDVCLILIGKEYEKIEKHDKIINFPILDYQSTLHILKNYSDCLVVPSKSEGFGRVYFEAMSYNKVSLIPEKSMLSDLIKVINPNSELIIKTDLIKTESIKNIKNTMFNVLKYYEEFKSESYDLFNKLKQELTNEDFIKTITEV